MRLTSMLEMIRGAKTGYVRRGRFIEKERVPFQQLLPLTLRNRVSGKSDKATGSVCVQEMSVLFACLKRNEFNNAKCADELKSFSKCYSGQLESRKAQKNKDLTSGPAPGEARLSHRQINHLLTKYQS